MSKIGLTGELAFEHGFKEGSPDALYRLHLVKHKDFRGIDHPVRSVSWFASKDAALTELERCKASYAAELVSLDEYHKLGSHDHEPAETTVG